ncbi:MAG: dihydroorotate dehydrogenase [Armatimonadota bacterium]|nr:dihydroorotate dehydrogenase [Armatimonadota bacterium]
MSDLNLSVNIAGIKMKNPVMTASGTSGFGEEMAEFFDLGKLGAFVTKGTSLHPWKGNETPRTTETPAGMLNAIGLQNDGVEAFITKKLPFLRRFAVPIIVNVVGHSVEEYIEVTKRLSDAEGIAALEINVSCPNVKEGCMVFGSSAKGIAEVISAVRAATTLPVIPKLTPNVTDIVETALAAVDSGADALCLINTLLGTAIDIKTRAFKLANITGGLSGPAIKPIALRMVYQVAQAVRVPIIGVGGIMHASDAVEFILAGASAVQIGTATFFNPMSCMDIIDGIANYAKSQGISSIGELIGAARQLK